MEKKIFASVALACCCAGASAQTAPADSTRAEANVNAADSTREAVSLDSVSRQMELAGVTVKGSRKTTRADRDTYTFTEEQVEKAQHAADLVATLRDVHVDPVSSRLKMMDGGKVMLLLNGVPCSDYDLKSVPANKVIRVEQYVVPPAKYVGMGTVVDIITKRLDNGFALGVGGQHALTTKFGDAGTWLRLTSGRHQLSFDYSLSYRNYSDCEWTERFDIPGSGKGASYIYHNSWPFGYTNNDFDLKYTYNKPEDLVMQVAFSPSLSHSFGQADMRVTTIGDDNWAGGNGESHRKLNTFGPTVNVYLNKKIGKKHEIVADVVGTYYHNDQSESNRQWAGDDGATMLDDNMTSRNHKVSLIAEMMYTRLWKNSSMNIGYRGMAGRSTAYISNTLSDNREYRYRSANSSHYAYAEYGGSHKRLGYRVSAGATLLRTSNDDTHQTSVVFSPQLLLSYSYKNGIVRLELSSQSEPPGISQLSNNAVQLAYRLVKRGNPYLRSSNTYSCSLSVGHRLSWIDLNVSMLASFTNNPINTYYHATESGSVVQTYENAESFRQLGATYSVAIRPFSSGILTVNLYGKAVNQRIDSRLMGVSSKWYTPLWYTVNLSHGRFGAYYTGNIVSRCISGPYLSDDENAGHVMVYYRHKQLMLNVGCYWAFSRSKYHSETLPNDIIAHSSTNIINDNASMFVIGASYTLFKGKDSKIRKKITNRDTDKGTF